ncbi:MAG: LytTR family transcriptional regulator DNA-binding domain-containing protein [Bacilli bacterium]|nr:LytTR family transcriptional regulator DNA-binding domain-containing protein [Bacilli bacterium]
MINFIIVDDNVIWREQVSSIIDKIMIKTNFEYNKKIFEEYNNIFISYTEKEFENKIYILDIKTQSKNGIDAARKIRLYDKEATIIFLTAYEEEYSIKILKSVVEVFSLISKKEDIEESLEKNILKILERIKENKEILKLIEKNSIYAIPLSKIVYMTTDNKKRKTIIQTESNKVYSNKALKFFEQKYSSTLLRTHKSCLVNFKKVINFDFKQQKIYFNNGSNIELLSKKYKNKIKERIFVKD